jgi:hypothetical protein
VILLVTWLVGAVRAVGRDPLLVFAGALAISTSFSNTSWDYNLVTCLPLLVVQYQRASEVNWRPLADALLLLGLVAVIGNRVLFSFTEELLQARVLLLWGWLTGSGLLVAWLAAPGEGEGSPAQASPGAAPLAGGVT